MNLWKRRIAGLALTGVLAGSMVGHAGAAEPIKIGEINSYKSQPAFLEPYRKGMELAVEEINEAGGIEGRKLVLITRDDNANPGDAVRAAEELLTRERVDVLAGSFLSHIGLALADFARQRKTFFLASETITDKVVGKRQPIYVPVAYIGLYVDRDVDSRGGQAQQEALGDRLSQL